MQLNNDLLLYLWLTRFRCLLQIDLQPWAYIFKDIEDASLNQGQTLLWIIVLLFCSDMIQFEQESIPVEWVPPACQPHTWWPPLGVSNGGYPWYEGYHPTKGIWYQ